MKMIMKNRSHEQDINRDLDVETNTKYTYDNVSR